MLLLLLMHSTRKPDTEDQSLQTNTTEDQATTMVATQEQDEYAKAIEERVQLVNRPKRTVIKPSYLRDYV